MRFSCLIHYYIFFFVCIDQKFMLNNSSGHDLPRCCNTKGNTCNAFLLNMLFHLYLFYMGYLRLRRLPLVGVCIMPI